MIFVPVSGLEDGVDARRIEERVPVYIGSIALVADAPMRQPPAEEQERLRREEDMR